MKFKTFHADTACVCRARSLVSRVLKHSSLLACFMLAISAKATLPTSDLPDIGPLGDFAILGSQLNDNQAAISGNVGIFSDGKLKLQKPSKTAIDGNVFLATNATFVKMSLFNGTVFTNADLSAQQDAVISQSTALAQLSADVTITKLQTQSLSYDVPTGEVEVVNLDKGLSLNNQNITLTGGGDLVLNIQGKFSLNGSAGIQGNPDDIFVNYEGTGTISSHAKDSVDGLVFDPNGAAKLNGGWTGGFFGGKKAITLMSGATVTQAPEPGSMVLLSIGLASLLMARRRRCSRQKQSREKTAADIGLQTIQPFPTIQHSKQFNTSTIQSNLQTVHILPTIQPYGTFNNSNKYGAHHRAGGGFFAGNFCTRNRSRFRPAGF